jgi:dipeptidyl aminopeptidase/acylaminoacyl peptidase
LPVITTEVTSPSVPLSLTAQLTSTHATNQPINQSTNLLTLSFSPDGATLAVATQDRVIVYDLAAPAMLAMLDAGGPAELAWSPDGQQLALAYPAGEGNAVALWSLDDGRLRVLAQMEAAGRLAWAPDGSKLAFDARTSPGTPSSQGGLPDVYVLYLRSGEIANLTEVFVRNVRVDASQRIGGWAPQWEADSETVRYVRGVPGQVGEQNVVRHPLRSRTSTVLWPAADEGKLGVVAEPGGPRLARVILRDGRDVVQVSPVANAWQDATPGAFVELTVLAWAPAGGEDAPRLLLLADRQTLWLLDPATGSLSGLAVACPDCVVTQAVWLP